MSQIFLLAWRNLFRNKRRTAASVLTVSLGAAGLLIFQGFNNGIMNQYRENRIRVSYGHGQLFNEGYYQTRLEEPWKGWIENKDEVEAALKRVPGIIDVYPRVSFYAFIMKGGTTLAGKGEGVIPERENKFFTRMNFLEGRDIQGPGEMMIGKGLARALNVKTGDRLTILGQTIHGQLNGLELKVSGIFNTGVKELDEGYFRLDLSQAQSLLDTNRVELFALQTTGVDAWPKVAAGIKKELPKLEAIPFDELDAVYYKNSVDFLNSQFNVIRLIIVVIVGLGIFNTITVGLFERAGEVGALRANGESRGRLLRILMLESGMLGLLGGLVGIGLAVLLDNTLLARGIPLPPPPGIDKGYWVFLEIEASHYTQAILLPAFTAVVASLIPIRRLLMTKIPELLRSH